jgi:selenocysteine-specific elongation factor
LDPAEQRLVLGTAGHIDHGKTALIRALTGVDTDRLPEEKARGITIDLGFAPLDLEGGVRLGVVDVPGHERLVRTMVAGATGIDLLLLVVAADEGVMPQTREHVAICDLLGITRGVVALTKTDLAEEGLAELAAEEVASLLAETGLAGAEIVPVSAQTGEGLDALREALGRLAAGATPHTTRSGPPRLARASPSTAASRSGASDPSPPAPWWAARCTWARCCRCIPTDRPVGCAESRATASRQSAPIRACAAPSTCRASRSPH